MRLRVEAAGTDFEPSADEVAALAAVLLATSPALPLAPPAPGSRWRAAGRVYGDDTAR